MAAILASGLPEESRCRRRASGDKFPMDTVLLAHIADHVALLLWRYAKQGTPQPESCLAILEGQTEEKPKLRVFRDGAAFEKALSRFVAPGGENHGR